MTPELMLIPAVVGLLFAGWLLVELVRQAHSKIIFGKWLAHPLAEKVALLEALLEAKEANLKELKEKLAEQDEQMQEVYATLMTKIKGG